MKFRVQNTENVSIRSKRQTSTPGVQILMTKSLPGYRAPKVHSCLYYTNPGHLKTVDSANLTELPAVLLELAPRCSLLACMSAC